MVEWCDLPMDLLGEIAKRVMVYEDFVAFSGVCSSWRSVAVKDNFSSSPQLPWLMLAEKENSDTRGFFSLTKGMVQERMLPEGRGRRCWSSQGWLITIGVDLSMNLLNPLTQAQIQLPHQRTFKAPYRNPNPRRLKESYIHKAILSSSPSWNSNYVVMVIHGGTGKLAYARPGDEAWTLIDAWWSSYADIVFYKGQFYAVNYRAQVVIFDIESPNSTEARILTRAPDELLGILTSTLYIVELSGALVVVSRTYVEVHCEEEEGELEEDSEEEGEEEEDGEEEDSEDEDEDEDEEEEEEEEEEEVRQEADVPTFSNIWYQTVGFQVFELDLISGKWAKVGNLGDKAMFLGHNSSMSVVASDIPRCEANCIYFTDDRHEYYYSHSDGGGNDMGIFNFQDGSIKHHYMGDSRSRLTTPMWVVPRL